MDGWMGGWVDRQTDRQIEGWMDRKTDDRYIVFIGNTYVYNIYTKIFMCFCEFHSTPNRPTTCSTMILPQDVYIAALAPLELPGDARTLVVQVLTSSGPAPDALVVPLVDESYQATRPKNGSD